MHTYIHTYSHTCLTQKGGPSLQTCEKNRIQQSKCMPRKILSCLCHSSPLKTQYIAAKRLSSDIQDWKFPIHQKNMNSVQTKRLIIEVFFSYRIWHPTASLCSPSWFQQRSRCDGHSMKKSRQCETHATVEVIWWPGPSLWSCPIWE